MCTASVPDVPSATPDVEPLSSSSSEGHLFSPEQQKLYEQHYREGYDVPDVEYESWLQIMHLGETKSEIGSSRLSACKSKFVSSSVSPILQEMLVLPHLKQSTGRKRRALNSEGLCITDSEVLDGLKAEEEENGEAEKEV